MAVRIKRDTLQDPEQSAHHYNKRCANTNMLLKCKFVPQKSNLLKSTFVNLI